MLSTSLSIEHRDVEFVKLDSNLCIAVAVFDATLLVVALEKRVVEAGRIEGEMKPQMQACFAHDCQFASL